MRKPISAILALCMLLGLAACIQSPEPPSYDDGVFRVSRKGENIAPRETVRAFADEYIAGRPCVLEMENDGANSVKYSFDAYGSVMVTGPDAVPGGYGCSKLVFDRQSDTLRMYLTGKEWDSPTGNYAGYTYISLGGADAAEHSGENSDRVFDDAKTEPVAAKDGKLISGAETLRDYFVQRALGRYAKAKAGDITLMTVAGRDFEFTEDGELSAELRWKYPLYSDTAQLYIVRRTYDERTETVEETEEKLFEITYKELTDAGLLFCLTSASNIGYLYNEQRLYNSDEDLRSFLNALGKAKFEAVERVAPEDGAEFTTFGARLTDGGRRVRVGVPHDERSIVAVLDDAVTDTHSANTDRLASLANRYRFDFLPEIRESDGYDIGNYYVYCRYAYALCGFPEHVRGGQFKGILARYFQLSMKLSDDYYVPADDEKQAVSYLYPVYYAETGGSLTVRFNCYAPDCGFSEEEIRAACKRGDAEQTIDCSRRVTVKFADSSHIACLSCIHEQKSEDGQWQDVGTSGASRTGELARAALESWLESRDDLTAFKTGKAAGELKNGYGNIDVQVKVLPANGAKDGWLARGFSECADGWLLGGRTGAYIENGNGTLSYLDGCQNAETLDDALSILGKRAFDKYLDEADGLKDHRINKLTVTREHGKLRLYAEFDVLPKGSAKNKWLAENGRESKDGWVLGKVLFANARIRDGELLLSDFSPAK